MKKVFYLFAICGILFTSCDKEKDKEEIYSFLSPEKFLEHPLIKKAIEEAGIEVNKGDNPPTLEGTYLTSGSVIMAHQLYQQLVGVQIRSEFILSNQTSAGTISFRENVGGITATGIGGFITGENGKFTIYGVSTQGTEAGLPAGVSADVVLLMLGTRLSNENLTVKGLTIITSISPAAYKSIEGAWYMWDANFNLQTGAKSVEHSSEISKKLTDIHFNYLTN